MTAPKVQLTLVKPQKSHNSGAHCMIFMKLDRLEGFSRQLGWSCLIHIIYWFFNLDEGMALSIWSVSRTYWDSQIGNENHFRTSLSSTNHRVGNCYTTNRESKKHSFKAQLISNLPSLLFSLDSSSILNRRQKTPSWKKW